MMTKNLTQQFFFVIFFFAGATVCSAVCATEEDISQCASSAASGFKAWSALTCQQRAKVLLRSRHPHSPLAPNLESSPLPLSAIGLTALSLLHLQAGGRHRAARSVLVRAVRPVRGLLLPVHPGPTAAVLQWLGSAQGRAHGQLGAAGWGHWGGLFAHNGIPHDIYAQSQPQQRTDASGKRKICMSVLVPNLVRHHEINSSDLLWLLQVQLYFLFIHLFMWTLFIPRASQSASHQRKKTNNRGKENKIKQKTKPDPPRTCLRGAQSGGGGGLWLPHIDVDCFPVYVPQYPVLWPFYQI